MNVLTNRTQYVIYWSFIALACNSFSILEAVAFFFSSSGRCTFFSRSFAFAYVFFSPHNLGSIVVKRLDYSQ